MGLVFGKGTGIFFTKRIHPKTQDNIGGMLSVKISCIGETSPMPYTLGQKNTYFRAEL